MTRDRRAPVARYVQFRDQERAQPLLISHAELTFARLMGADGWTAEATIELASGDPTTARRGLFRRQQATAGITAPVAPALAEAHRIARTEPAAMQLLGGCLAGTRMAALIGQVLAELVGDLARLPVAEQREHAAYRQTLRLASELSALVSVSAEVGCTDPLGCVALRRPEQWGRREEDVEVAEVQAVLRELAEAANRRD